MKKLLFVLFLCSVSNAVQVCKEVVNCEEVRGRLSKDEQKCLCQKQKIKVVEKMIVVEKEVFVQPPKNSLSLLGGRTETGLKTDSVLPTFHVHSTGEFDLGLMYQRELGKNFRGSAIGTWNGSFYGGIGYNF